MSVICLKAYRDEKIVREISAPSAAPEWSFEQVKARIRARFGNNIPKFVEDAWKRKSREPYRFGCTHNVQYRSVRPKYWNRPMPFPMDMDVASDVIGKDVGRGGSDPCAWLDLKYRVTWTHIRNRRGMRLVIHTRSDLIAHDDYLDVIDPVNHRVMIYVLDATPDVLRRAEPGAPSNERRRQAVDKLMSRGIPVQVVHIPPSVLTRNGGAA